MRTYLALLLLALVPLMLSAQPKPTKWVSRKYVDVVQARIDDKYVLLIDKDGSRSLLPIETVKSTDLKWFQELSEYKTVEHAQVQVVAGSKKAPAEKPSPKQTIVLRETVDGVERVQLVSPNVFYDQIGGTCMLYARVHWLDIAGYYSSRSDIYKIINGTPPMSPWSHPKYMEGLNSIIYDRPAKPKLHRALPYGNNFEWAREQLRLGRPILAALPREIWQALPADYLASRVWSGGSVGHQIVVNGFTFDPVANSGSFHVVNSWAELQEFELPLRDAQNGNLVFEYSLSPYGESRRSTKSSGSGEQVLSIELIKSAGSSNLYRVKTNKGTRRILATDKQTAKQLVEESPQ